MPATIRSKISEHAIQPKIIKYIKDFCELRGISDSAKLTQAIKEAINGKSKRFNTTPPGITEFISTESSKNSGEFEILSKNLASHIGSFLDTKSTSRFALSNKALHNALDDWHHWHTKLLTYFPDHMEKLKRENTGKGWEKEAFRNLVELYPYKTADISAPNEDKLALHLAWAVRANDHESFIKAQKSPLMNANQLLSCHDELGQKRLFQLIHEVRPSWLARYFNEEILPRYTGIADLSDDTASHPDIAEIRQQHSELLQWSIACKQHTLTLELLKKNVALHADSAHLNIAMQLAVSLGDIKSIKALLEALLKLNPVVDIRDHYGRTPLHRAAFDGLLESIQCGYPKPILADAVSQLIAAGANINARDIRGRTPLHIAVLESHNTMGSLLSCEDIDVNARDHRGRTPLHLAARYYPGAVKQLLAHRAIDVNVLDNDGKSALDHAIEKGHDDVIEQLKAHPDIALPARCSIM